MLANAWRALMRHAPLFGCADHPDVDPELIDAVLDQTYLRLAAQPASERDSGIRAQAVERFVAALASARGLPVYPLDAQLEHMLERAALRLQDAAGGYVAVREAFAYHQSLARHYGLEKEAFDELIEWTSDALRQADPSPRLARFLARSRGTRPPHHRASPARPPKRAHARPSALPFALGELGLPTRLEPGDPSALARIASAAAPKAQDDAGAGAPFSQRWYLLLCAELDTHAEEASLPPLVESALLVHLLGLEPREHKAVLSAAADNLLLHRLLPSARAVGGRNQRHEPVAVALVSVLAKALRPWTFEAPPASVDQRVLLLALLSELGTSKARKLLHQAKKHASRHAQPERIRAAVNRGLDRLPQRAAALSPRRRIDHVAAALRYLNRQRRGLQPRARDQAIVSQLLS